MQFVNIFPGKLHLIRMELDNCVCGLLSQFTQRQPTVYEHSVTTGMDRYAPSAAKERQAKR